MVKYEIFQERSEEEEEPIIRLRMIESEEGIEIIAVNEYGKRISQGSLITFLKDGTIRRHWAVNPFLGFKLGEDGEILFEDELEEEEGW